MNILNNEKRDLEDRMDTYSNTIRKIIVNNKKYMVNLAIVETRTYGGHIY